MPTQPNRKEEKMINVCSSTRTAYCDGCIHLTACHPNQPAQISPTFKPMIDELLSNRLFALFQIRADGDGYPTYELIGIFSSISDAGNQITGLYTIVDRATLNAQTDDRYSIPYDYIIEPMTIDQPAPAHIYHACENCNLTHNTARICADCTK